MNHQTDTGESIIRSMPPDLANKIAAGEVVQRPGSVVKELIDNAIDAGAEHIRIVIRNSGRTLIQVTDDGCGMGPEDLRPCFQPHATSKIRQMEDLFRIRTLGFRGEAMASIASVAQVELKSRRLEDEAGYLIEIHGGEEKRFEPAAAEPGTSVTIRNLFYNVPARRQFLRSDATEFRHILKTVQQAALADPETGFELIADDETIFRLAPSPLEERIAELFGRHYRSSLIPFQEETSYVTIRGFLGDPALSRRSRGEQFIFVNGRPVQHRVLAHVALSIYEGFLGEGEYPFFAIYLTLDPQQVDVNVHPAKQEVQFEDAKSIIQLTRSVLRKALNQFLMVPDIPGFTVQEEDGFSTSLEGLGLGPDLIRLEGEGEASRLKIPSRINFDRPSGDGLELGEALYGMGREETAPADGDEERRVETRQQKDRGFWQLHDRYILTQTRTGLCIIDQYRAHMRIIYEKTLSVTEEALPATQQLLFARNMEFAATDFTLLRELLPIIQRMGFSIQLLSGHSAVIHGVPADINIGDEQKVLREMLQEYRFMEKKPALDARRKVAVAFASRTAIPRGRRLSEQEMESLIDQLFACEEPYADPLGKPVLVYLPMEEIVNRFR